MITLINNKDLIESALEEIAKKGDLVESDYYRPRFHIAPRVGLINDPNGFVYYKGYYHLFYQWHPFDTKHGLKYWYHLRSKDLICWEEVGVGLAPEKWYESHGCYSGSAIEHDGEMVIFYTGNVKDKEGNRESYQCMAFSKDGFNVEKYEDNPVIESQPEGYTAHFRDPKVWKQGELWYMVLGAQTESLEGRVLLYNSENLQAWKLVGVVSGSNINNNDDMGYMWECPDLFSLGHKDILITCPQGMKAQGTLYNNRYQAGYFVGSLNYEAGVMNHGGFTELDRGFEFYAPQTCKDNLDRRVIYGWMGMPEEEEQPTKEYHWLHMLTLPRILELKDNKIYQRVPEELKKLRKNSVLATNVKLKDDDKNLEGFYGDVYEICLDLDIQDAEEVGLKLRCSEDGAEYTMLRFLPKEKLFTIDRSNSGKALGGERSCKLKENKSLKLQIFSDRSSLEIFINGGEEVFSLRVFPSLESKNIKFFSKGGTARFNNIKFWEY